MPAFKLLPLVTSALAAARRVRHSAALLFAQWVAVAELSAAGVVVAGLTGFFGLRSRIAEDPAMQLTSYDVDWLARTPAQLGFRDIEICVVFSDSAMGAKHPFVFARKAAI